MMDGFPNEVGFPNTVEGFPTTTGDLTLPLSPGFALSWNMITCLTGGFCVDDMAAVDCLRGRPRPRDVTTSSVSADDGSDFTVVFSANSHQLITGLAGF